MNTVSTVPQNLRLTDRLSFRLLVLFLGVFTLTFFGLWGWSISKSFVESAIADQAATARPQPVVIDPKLRDELAAVMSLSTTPPVAEIRDPFADRTGIVAQSAAQRSVNGVVTSTGGSGGSSTVASGNSPSGGGRSNTIVGPGRPSGVGQQATPLVPASEMTKARWDDYLRRAARGDVPLDPRIFSIEDLLPVGVVDGGDGRQEVMFYSQAAARTFSFPVGTMFADGWLTELRPEGVVFGTGDEQKSYRLRSWTRSLQNVG